MRGRDAIPTLPAGAFAPPDPAPAQAREFPRVCLFTDTLADINGVSRFVRAVAADKRFNVNIITSTRLECPQRSNVHNIRPLLSRPMPGYATIDVAAPNPPAVRRCADALHPDIIHVSTPGPVGWLGRRYAMTHGLPLVCTYHTDFPAYVEHLFQDPILGRMSERIMRWFYRPFDLVLVRSPGSARLVERLGIESSRIAHLPPGIDTEAFHPRQRDPSGGIWRTVCGARAESLKVLYVGRVSVEKNLPMLARVWVRASARGFAHDTQLIVVGDGPHRAAMQRELAGHDVCFAGFRHGEQLAAIYASSDLFVFPSTTDTLGQAVMEAQASGLLALVSDRGGPAHTVQQDRTGLILPNAEPAWVDAILRLISLPHERARLGAAAHARLASMTIHSSVEHFHRLHADLHETGDGVTQKQKPGRALARGPARR